MFYFGMCPSTPLAFDIVCNCLTILQEHAYEDAKKAAIAMLSKTRWRELNWNVVYRCLEIFATFEIDSTIIAEIISEYSSNPNAKGAYQ